MSIDQTMTFDPLKDELGDNELDHVTGGDKSTTKETGPAESISLNFTKVAFKY